MKSIQIFSSTVNIEEWINPDTGFYHREDGPALITSNGFKFWIYNGNLIHCNSQEEFERLLKLKAFW